MSELPSGTVTLVFTDVEGSTRLLDELGDAYGEVLRRHLELLRAAFTAHGGLEIDNQGDSLFAVFAGAGNAVRAAAEAQRALADESWPGDVDVRVRIGIHSGEPTPTGSRYVGHDVHRAARVSAAAHGGQVVLTRTTRELSPGTEVLDLGDHRLKDIAQPVRLFQLIGDGLRSDFPPLRTLRATNLPLPPTPLVGREREKEEVTSILSRPGVRLVSITGPGGAGKTKLAVHVATDLVEEFEGVFFVPLAGLQDATLVASAIAQAVGAQGDATDEALAAELEGRRALLVLDNFEHVLSAASVVTDLLRSIAGPVVLVTSRERLRVRSEHTYALTPLLEDDAVALFDARAETAAPGLRLDRSDREIVAEICRRLDCLPLAIELAAARVRVLSPRDLLARLDRRLTLLSGGPRDLPERQRALRAAIEWSYDLLSEDERTVFARLGVFAGGVTVEAAEAVCGDASADLLTTLESLLDKNLLAPQQSRDERRRFYMLDTMREYAVERLEAKSAHAATLDAFVRFFVGFAETCEAELLSAGQAAALHALEDEHDNLRAALACATGAGKTQEALRLGGALWRFWHARGYLREGGEWSAASLALAGGTPSQRSKALYGAAVLSAVRGALGEAERLAEERLALVREHEPAEVTSALAALANVVMQRDHRDRAAALFAEASELARESGDNRALAGITGNLGYLALLRGAWDEAAALCASALELYRELDHGSNVAVALLNLAFAELHRNRFADALADLAEGVALCRTLEDREGLSYCFEGVAAATAASNAEHAAILVGASEALREAVGASLQPHERDLHDRTIAILVDRLGADALEHALAEGAQLPLDEALAILERAATGASSEPSLT
jgi:predicted ATPase/class 3 adenylate cyclase